MKCDINIDGLRDMIDALERAGAYTALQGMQEKAAKRITKNGKQAMEKHVPVSRDNSRSGRKSSRPPGHARDNIPTKVTTKKEVVYADIGWYLSDNSKFYYMKFIEWGTYMQPPRPFLQKTVDDLGTIPTDIVQEELADTLTSCGIAVDN